MCARHIAPFVLGEERSNVRARLALPSCQAEQSDRTFPSLCSALLSSHLVCSPTPSSPAHDSTGKTDDYDPDLALGGVFERLVGRNSLTVVFAALPTALGCVFYAVFSLLVHAISSDGNVLVRHGLWLAALAISLEATVVASHTEVDPTYIYRKPLLWLTLVLFWIVSLALSGLELGLGPAYGVLGTAWWSEPFCLDSASAMYFLSHPNSKHILPSLSHLRLYLGEQALRV